MGVNLQQFIEHLSRSGLLSAADVASFQDSLPADNRPADVESLARALIKAGRRRRTTMNPGSTSIAMVSASRSF